MPSIFRLAGDTSSTDTPVDTSTNAPSILAINGFFCGFTVLVVLARIYVRAFMLKTFGVDDFLITAATVRSILSFSAQGYNAGMTGHLFGPYSRQNSLITRRHATEHWKLCMN